MKEGLLYVKVSLQTWNQYYKADQAPKGGQGGFLQAG
jgi:hypothetical protein